MVIASRCKKWALAGLSALGGAAFVYCNVYGNCDSFHAYNSWATNYTPSESWDHNWDRRDPKNLGKYSVLKQDQSYDNKYMENSLKKQGKATRYLVLIRHGQYNTSGRTDSERILTELGVKQAQATGKRLAELGKPYTKIVRSTMTRAQQTSKIIEQYLTNVEVENDSLLIEGAPIPPEPSFSHWRSEVHFFQDGARIEAAFRKYFYRADPSQEKDSYTILVCHANVIRYFVCRALQFPPEAWMRMCLNHASITWLRIKPNGRVTLFCLGDTGHITPENLSYV